MKNKFILKLFIFMVFTVSLYSCIHDDVSSASDPSSKEYTNKTLWKQDEKYIKNVMQVYQENEDKIKKAGGTPYWDYASTLESFDETFVMVPIVESGRIVSVLQVPRHGSKIRFYYTNFQTQIDFFQALVFAKYKKTSDASSETDKTIVCKTVTVSVWLPDSESNPEPESGAGHWGVHSVVKCRQMLDNCSGVVGPNGECITGGGTGDPGDFPYPGGGGNPETPVEDPCQKTKSLLANPKVQAKINDLKTQSTAGGEIGVKFKADGTPSATIQGGRHSVNLGDKTGYAGGYHNHTPSGIPMLSPPDIDQLLGFARAQGNYGDPTKAYLGMVAPNGMHYVIQFNGDHADALVTFTDDDLDAYIIRYQTRYGLYKPSTEDSIERFFFKTLKDMGLDGKVNLQRIESNGTIKLITKNENGTTTATPCL
ncbi:hypothetical protein M2347_002564 [Chryseobacterium sp. H1D6B]|uniref:hypothetical protein n=1 Tax=Chryseobacterium sp. H1D6B TaxID=2940588 RepID=UPI0015CBA33A|nr:hypothetical protein [Chryseobacterium sp. H1D6B]MDH6252837.1 hypothetical protein [Chryseobacterium sp. H1D6B]